ncbi:MAG: polysaccharide deacetylase family protein [Bacillota bacterium]|nr:polysaccharide deacetylase family protein [Bacillota bacterium]
MKRRVFSIFLALIMAFSFTMSFSFAEDAEGQETEAIENSELANPDMEQDSTKSELEGEEESAEPAAVGQVDGLNVTWDGTDVILSWNEVSGAEGYEVYRSHQSKAEDDFGFMADVSAQDELTFTDPERDKQFVDIYRVRAYVTDQESGEKIYGDYSANANSVKVASRIPIMTYHHLCAKNKFKKIRKYRSLYVKDSDFRSQMNWLKNNGWRTISTDEIAQWYDNEIELPYKSTLITFDDGCYSVLKYAYPVLKANNQKATIFMQGNKTGVKTNTSCSRGYKFKTIGKDKMEQIKDEYPNLEFQSHTWRMHDRIKKKKPIYKFTQAQIDEDCNRMQETFGYTAIAYPWGTYTSRILSSLEQNGNYKIGFTYGSNAYATKAQNRFALKRIKVSGGASLKKFKKWFN